MREIILEHRQDPQTQFGDPKKDHKYGKDDVPGKVSLQVHECLETSPNPKWRFWAGSSSGNNGAKYAEIQSSAEIDNLYDWATTGHMEINNRGAYKEKRDLCIDGLRIHALGRFGVPIPQQKFDEVVLHGVKVRFKPSDNLDQSEFIFTPGLDFKAQTFGVKQKYVGQYPGAIPVGRWQWPHEASPLPQGWSVRGNRMIIPLQNHKKIFAVEVAGGDQKGDVENRNEDGGMGSKGYAKLDIYIQKARGQKIYLLRNENVAPQSFYQGIVPAGYKYTHGDHLIIESRKQFTMVMGVKIGEKDD